MPLAEMLANASRRAIIFSGGPASVHVDGAPSIDPAIYDAGVPSSASVTARSSSRSSSAARSRETGGGEYGRTELTRRAVASVLFAELPDEQIVWMSHGDAITAAPDGFVVTASHRPARRSPRSRTASAAIYGVQFHPEVVHTERGQEVLQGVPLRRVRVPAHVDERRRSSSRPSPRSARRSGRERVICGLSGGVDSAVAAALVHKAIGDQLTCVFVDTGLLRLDEAEQVEETFRASSTSTSST